MTTRAGQAAPERELAGRRARASFLAELGEAAAGAAELAGGWQDHACTIAGDRLLLRIAGNFFPPVVLPAFAHLSAGGDAPPALTVHLWDSASTGTPMPSPPWSRDDYGPHGTIRGWFGDRCYAIFERASGFLTVLDVDARTAYVWSDGRDFPPVFERAAPLRTLLHVWLDRMERQLVHAAAVVGDEGAALIVGNAGAGKSSLAMACVLDGLDHLADDYCVLEGGAPARVSSVYCSAKANADTIARLGLQAEVSNPVRPGYEKALMFLDGRLPGRVVRQAPLRAIVIPRVSGERNSVMTRATGAAALRALAPSTLLQMPGTAARTLTRLASVVRGVPVHRMDAGTDRHHAAATVRGLVETW